MTKLAERLKRHHSGLASALCLIDGACGDKLVPPYTLPSLVPTAPPLTVRPRPLTFTKSADILMAPTAPLRRHQSLGRRAIGIWYAVVIIFTWVVIP